MNPVATKLVASDRARAARPMLVKDPKWFESVCIKELARDKAIGLVCVDSQGRPTEEECIFTVYRELAKKDLPPLKLGVKQFDADGLETQPFRAAIDGASDVCEFFNRVFKEGTLKGWKDGLPGNGEKLLDMSNKSVTPAAEARDQEHIPFDSSNELAGFMDTLMKNGFIRTQDNVV
ncbi:hypothetical protein DXG01_008130 [Tephrocybe rancida]|nr:hypothetical protein DXG01_008130 [Tephrocybe rancida]